ncbi:MAG: FecCD family ABC transporter permease [Phycisphaerales bacterium]
MARPLGGGIDIGWPAPGILGLRVTSIAAAACVGASLALSGVLLQALLRNPLASPFVLGVSSGAALGVAVALAATLAVGAGAGVEAGFGSEVGEVAGGASGDAATAAGGGFADLFAHVAVALGAGGHVGPAFVGAGAALCAVLLLGRAAGGSGSGWIDPLATLLAGVVISSVCGALVLAMEHVAPGGLRRGMLAWLTGSIDELMPAGQLALCGGAACVGLVVGWAMAGSLDALSLGEDEARSVGVAVGPVRIGLLLVASACTAVAVAVAGPIAFVGLIAPHAARGLVGARHAWLIPAATLAGAALLVGADATAQLIRPGGGRLPVGVFTALVGGPAFLLLLRRVGRAS